MEQRNKIKKMVFAALFAALTAVGAWVTVPLGLPVPITLQTLFVLIAGAVLGSRLGALSQFIYVLIGLIGLPVFSGGKSGFPTLFGPSGGYLIGFIAGAFIVGFITERIKKHYSTLFISMLAGLLVIYSFGVIGGLLTTKLSLPLVIAGFVLPFIIWDIIKIIAASLIAYKLDIKKYFK